MLYFSRHWIGTFVVAFATAGCGGGDEGSVDVSKTVRTYDFTATAAVHTQQLAAAGVAPISVRCYRSIAVTVGTPSVMFVYEITASDAPKAESAGFTLGASRADFTPTSVPCTDYGS